MTLSYGTGLTGALSKTIEQRISAGVRDSLPKLDTFWRTFNDTYVGVTSQGIGREWIVIHTFSESLHGAHKWVDPAGSSIDTSTLTHSIIPSAVREYPGLEDATLPGYLDMQFPLVEALGNMFVPHQYLRLDKLSAAVGKAVDDIINGTAKLTALADVHAFYRTLSVKGSVCSVRVISGNTSTDITVSPRDGAINAIQNGMHVDVYDSTGATKRNTVCPFVVDGVRYVPASTDTGYGEFHLKTKDGTDTPTLTSGDVMVYADSAGYGPTGPAQWLANSGTVFGVVLTTYPQFQSVVQAVSGALDESQLNQYFSRCWKAWGAADMPDCVITSMGVTTSLLDSSYGLADRFIRNLGERNKLSMGFEEPQDSAYMFNGIPIRWHVSPFMPSASDFSGTQQGGNLWGLKTRDGNISRYVPPPLPGAKRHSAFGREVEFVYPSGGPGGIFSPYKSTTGRSTEWAEAPFNRWVEYAPTFMPGLNLTSITETL